MTSRFVHVVRCKAMNSDGSLDDTKYADVQVIDMVCVTDDNGGQEIFNFTAANAVPTIVDVAGDGGGVDNGDAATRQSRLLRVTNPNDSTMFFNEEVLDRVCVTRNGGAQEVWDFSQVNAFIEATTGPDISVDSIVSDGTVVSDQNAASRLIEVDEILPGQTNAVPPQSNGTNYMAVADPQGICLTINGQAIFDFRNSNRDITDTTQYTTDASGNSVPPDNTDPDPYLVIPSDSSGLSTGNALVQQGLLWKIINYNSSPGDLFIVGGYQQTTFALGQRIAAPIFILDKKGEIFLSLPSELFLLGASAYVDNEGNSSVITLSGQNYYTKRGALVFSTGTFPITFTNGGKIVVTGASITFQIVSASGVIESSVNTGAAPFYGAVDSKGAIFILESNASPPNVLQKLVFDSNMGTWVVAWNVSLSTPNTATIGVSTDVDDNVWIGIQNNDPTVFTGAVNKYNGETGAQLISITVPAAMSINFDTSPTLNEQGLGAFDTDRFGNVLVWQYPDVIGEGWPQDTPTQPSTLSSYGKNGAKNWSAFINPPKGFHSDFIFESAVAAGQNAVVLCGSWDDHGADSFSADWIVAVTPHGDITGPPFTQVFVTEAEANIVAAQWNSIFQTQTISGYSDPRFQIATTVNSTFGRTVQLEAAGTPAFNYSFSAVVTQAPGSSSTERPPQVKTFVMGLDPTTGAQLWIKVGSATGIQNEGNSEFSVPLAGDLPFYPISLMRNPTRKKAIQRGI